MATGERPKSQETARGLADPEGLPWLENGERGLLRSRFFAGLWLDPVALLKDDKATLIAALNRGLASPEHAGFVHELERRRATRGQAES